MMACVLIEQRHILRMVAEKEKMVRRAGTRERNNEKAHGRGAENKKEKRI